MFHHLAQRVLGHTRERIHAAVRLPYRDAPPLDPEVSVDHDAPSRPSIPVATDTRDRSAVASPGEQHRESHMVAAAAQAYPAADPIAEAAPTTGRQRFVTLDEAPMKDARNAVGDTDSRATPRVPGERPQADGRDAAPTPRTVGESMTTAAPREPEVVPVDTARQPHDPAAEAVAATPRHAEPRALLPPVIPVGVRQAPPSRRSESATHTQPDEPSQPNEVHVHIGRVEVTAVQESPAPRRPAARKGREPMSLDAYLAQRERERT